MRFQRSSTPDERRRVKRVRAPGTERRKGDRRAGPTVVRDPAIERRGAAGRRTRAHSVERRLVLLLRPY